MSKIYSGIDNKITNRSVEVWLVLSFKKKLEYLEKLTCRSMTQFSYFKSSTESQTVTSAT